VTTPPSAAPQLSPDGCWQWTGQEWVAVPPLPVAAVQVVPFPEQHAVAWAPPAPGAVEPAYADGKAIASLVLGVLWFFGLGSVAAVVLGHLSRSESRRAGRHGSGLALAGLILGYVGVAIMVIAVLGAVAIPVFLNQRNEADAAAVNTNLRGYLSAQETYRTATGGYGSVADLTAAGAAPAVSAGVRLDVLRSTRQDFCIRGTLRTQTSYATAAGILTRPCF
jgi:Tfp pilus assembly protein PilE